MIEVELGDHKIAVCNVTGQYHAIDGVCPHRGGSLAEGALHGTMVVCPWHAWEFDCVTGRNDYNPDVRQRRFTVRVDGDDVLIDI
jgi:nitrite reductase/ring-hydroxylating ferredoxin subunit